MGIRLALALLLLLATVQPPVATIAGRVTDRATGRPLPRMVVTAVGADVRKRVEAMTDADGRYEITGLNAGAYAIAVAHDEHRSTYLPQWFGDATPSGFFGPPTRLNVELKEGERRTGVDVALTRALAIEGRITDPWNDPLGEAVVWVVRAPGSMSTGREARTDDQGKYRVFGLAPGRYRVCARPTGSVNIGPPGDAPAMLRTCYPAAVTEAEASGVSLTSQDVTGIDIRVQRVGSRSIAGTVIDAAGVPVEGASVAAYPIDDNARTGSAQSHDGAFTIRGLVPGRYTLSASIGGSMPGDPNPPARERETGETVVDLAAIDATNVTVALAKAISVHGFVTLEGGPPPRTLRMRVATRTAADARAWRFGPPPTAPVRDDLTFDLGEIYRAPVTLAIQGLPEGWALKSVRLDGRDITDVPTDFTAAGTKPFEIVVTSATVRPTIRVTNDRDEELPYAVAIALPEDPARWKTGLRTVSVRLPAGIPVPQNAALLPGNYLVAALSMEDYLSVFQDSSRLDALARIATKVTFTAGDTRTLTLRVVPLPDK
jgi:protocatechuate 3,4-dioxygenase beta subunit